MKKFLIATLLCVAMTATMVPMAFAVDTNSKNYASCMAAISEQKQVQAQAHEAAESLRRQGYSDSHAYIQAAKQTWNAAQAEIKGYQKLSKYSDEDIRVLATMVYYEAGTTTEQLRQYVAQVAMNRVASSRFPNTVVGVITQRGQYSGNYASKTATDAIKSKDAKNGTYYYAMCENSVKQAMMGRVSMPANVVFQANFTQGKGVWKSVYYSSGSFASTSYFCYG